MTTLFDPVQLGSLDLKNRIVMAPLTRGRAGETRIPNAMMATYYAQRASAGLIIAEATAISEQGYGWPNAPGMYNDEQQKGWAHVTKAVHERGGKIILQLWHMGRVKDESTYKEGEKAVAPSAIAASNNIRRSSGKSYPEPRALDVDELPGIIENYVSSAKRAIAAGFDGVEVHAANGYLLDQFLRDGSNQRQDAYGGAVENRIRFPLEVIRAVADAVGAGRTGVRISPTNPFNDMSDHDPQSLFTAFAKALDTLGLAYLHILEPPSKDHPFSDPAATRVAPAIQEVYRGALMLNGGYDLESAQNSLAQKGVKAIAFGVPFIANPDLVERYQSGAPLNTPDKATFYTAGEKGYIDYPSLKDTEKAA